MEDIIMSQYFAAYIPCYDGGNSVTGVMIDGGTIKLDMSIRSVKYVTIRLKCGFKVTCLEKIRTINQRINKGIVIREKFSSNILGELKLMDVIPYLYVLLAALLTILGSLKICNTKNTLIIPILQYLYNCKSLKGQFVIIKHYKLNNYKLPLIFLVK